MRHIRIPVTQGHQEAGWFGYLYLWQCQSNGAVGSRLQMNDPRDWRKRDMDWEEPIASDAIAGDKVVPLEVDALDIMHDHYPRLRVAGTTEVKIGREWQIKV